jgi:hypothetical protein
MRTTSAVLAILAGCSGDSDGDGPSAAVKASWTLTLRVDGADVALPLETMNVMLAEDPNVRPEVFEVLGPSVVLVGDFPKGLTVGYGENWAALFGKSIAISPRGGDPREPKDSRVEIPGKGAWRVLGGTLAPEKLTGRHAGSKGDRTLHGRISLRVDTGAGEATVEGRFAVQAVTWG